MTDAGSASSAPDSGDAAAAAAASSAAAQTAAANAALASQIEERLIHQEYKIWKKNTPFLYDFVMTHGLEWPSLTCQWLPTRKELGGGRAVGSVGGTSRGGAEQHELLVGTHTTGEQNYLMVATVNLPREDAVLDNRAAGDATAEQGEQIASGEPENQDKKRKANALGSEAPPLGGANPSPKSIVLDAPHPATNYNEEKDELGGHASADRVGTIDIKMKIPHDGEVNRARYMPQNHFVVATRGPANEVYVWDLSQHASFPAPDAAGGIAGGPAHDLAAASRAPNPQVVCRGHEGEGYGLAWCAVPGAANKGKLVTGADDKTVRIWDVAAALAAGTSGTVVNPTATLRYHTAAVEDVDWHRRDAHMVGSCGDDRRICLWDVREGKHEKPMHVIDGAHGGDVNGLEFHPVNEFLFASGGSDRAVKLWDLRNLKGALQTFEGHTDQVYSVHWSPHDEAILASCSADRRVALWDLSRIGAEQTPEDAEDGPPELLFLHGGHTAKVNDFSWNPHYPWCLGGVSEDNVLQVWSPAEAVYAEEGDGDEEDGTEDAAMKPRAEILRDDEVE